MTKMEKMPQSVQKELFIDTDNFEKAKGILKENGINCTDRKLSEILSCDIRTMQKYRSKTKQFPIPRLRLERLAQYMDVSPDWLCGLNPRCFIPGPGWSEFSELQKVIKPDLLLKYLQSVGLIQYAEHKIDDYEGRRQHYLNVLDTPLSIHQTCKYIEELESAIQYVTDRFVMHVKEENAAD